MASDYSITLVVGSGFPGHATIQINGPGYTMFAGMGPATPLSLYSTGKYDVLTLEKGESPVGVLGDAFKEFHYVDSVKYQVNSYTFAISEQQANAARIAGENYQTNYPNYNGITEAVCTDYVLAMLQAALPGTNLGLLSRIPTILQSQLAEASQNGGSFTVRASDDALYRFETGLGSFHEDAVAPNFSPWQQFNDSVPFNYASGSLNADGQTNGHILLARNDDNSGQLASANGTVINFGAGTFGTLSQENGVMTIGSPTTGVVRFISVDPVTGIASVPGGYQASAGSIISVTSNSINVVQQQTTGTQTTTLNWEGELERVTKLNNDLSSTFRGYDPSNTHPYNELDVSEDATGQITAAQIQLDQNVIAAGGSIGQIFGSAIGNALAPNDPFQRILTNTVAGLIGQKLLQTFTASLTIDASRFVVSDFAGVSGLDVAHAGIGAISSFLTAELGHEMGLTGLSGQLFTGITGGVTGSVLNQVVDKIATGVSFSAAIDAINWGTAVTQAGYNVASIVGAYLGRELVPAQTHEGAVGGQLLGAVGSAIGISIVLANALGTVLNFVVPGVGSLIGTVVGTLIGDAFGSHPHPAAVDLIAPAGYLYGYDHSQLSASDGGDYRIPDQMKDPTLAIINAYLTAVKGAALDQSKQAIIGYTTAPDFRYLSGTPGHPERTFIDVNDAVHAVALDVLQHTEVIGGDLLMKRAHQNSPSNIPEPLPTGIPTPSQVSSAQQLVTMSGDLRIAQDYENYLNNKEAINALIAANPNSAFAAGWIATFARVNDLGLNHLVASDFLGGVVGWLDSVNKAGLGAEAANATVKLEGTAVAVEIRIANGADVPGALSVFADTISQTSDATGTTVRFVFNNGLAVTGFQFQGAGTAGNDILTGTAGDDTIHGLAGFDFIDGGTGWDHLYGEDGNDILRGGKGNDELQGGQGDDTYVFNRGDGADTVLDDYTATEFVPSGMPGGGSYQTVHKSAGTDRLLFGPGIAVSDIAVQLVAGGADQNLIVYVKDPAHPGQITDSITLQKWNDAYDRIETFAFADGTTLNVGAALATYQVPFGETLSRNSVAENSPVGTVVGKVATSDLDANAVLTYSLFDYGYGRFAIDPSSGVITVAGALNFEGTPSWPLTVYVTDQAGHGFDKPVTIQVTDVNEAPGDAILSGGSVAENSLNGTVVGVVSGSDPDAGASLRYALTDNAGGRFAINALTGVITVANGALLDYETAHSHQVSVRTIDQGGLSLDKNFTIAIGDVFERVHADFNGDGRSDVLWRAWDSGTPARGHVPWRTVRGGG